MESNRHRLRHLAAALTLATAFLPAVGFVCKDIARHRPAGMPVGVTFDHGDAKNYGFEVQPTLTGDAIVDGTHLELDGTGDRLRFDLTNSFTTDGAGNDQPFSISMWVDADTWSPVDSLYGSQVLACVGDLDAGLHELTILHYDFDGRIYVYLFSQNNGGVYKGRAAPWTKTINTWIHLCVTYDGSGDPANCKIYRDGVRIDNVTHSAGTYAHMSDTGAPLLFGKNYRAARPNDGLNGSMDDLRVYTRELSATEVSTLYSEGIR